MKQTARVVKQMLADLVMLRMPVTAAAVVALAVSLLGPVFGWHPSPDTEKAIIGALVGVGAVAAFVQKQITIGTEKAVRHAVSPSAGKATFTLEPDTSAVDKALDGLEARLTLLRSQALALQDALEEQRYQQPAKPQPEFKSGGVVPPGPNPAVAFAEIRENALEEQAEQERLDAEYRQSEPEQPAERPSETQSKFVGGAEAA